MGYFLKRNTIDFFEQIDITKAEFNELKEAKKVLRQALDIEDKYDLLISTYLELEKDALALTVDHMVKNENSYLDTHNKRVLINKRLVALLTTAKLYLDRVASETSKCTGNVSDKDSVSKSINEKYDSLPEYRFVEAMRNSVQHHSLPIHGMSFGSQKLEEDFQYTSGYFANKAEFEKNKSFKPSVLAEMPEMPEKVEVLNQIRVYISAISDVQSHVRKLINETVNSARSTIEGMVNRYKGFDDKGIIGLVAVHEISEEDYEVFEIFLDWDDVRLALIKKTDL